MQCLSAESLSIPRRVIWVRVELYEHETSYLDVLNTIKGGGGVMTLNLNREQNCLNIDLDFFFFLPSLLVTTFK